MERTYQETEVSEIAQELLTALAPSEHEATILALEGDLGAGKTTLAKSLAQLLGVQETVVSPTFVIAKFYPLANQQFETLVHIDAYRIESLEELGPLGWEVLVRQPKTLVIVEWPEKIAGALPNTAHYFTLTHTGDQRTITKR